MLQRGELVCQATKTMKSTFSPAVVILVMFVGCVGSRATMTTPDAQDPWVIRTDFSDDAKWTAVRELIAAPQTDFGQKFYAYVRYVSDEKYSGIECNELVHTLPDDYPGFLCFVVDETTLTDDEHPVLVVDFGPDSTDMEDYRRTPGQTPVTDIKTFRAIPSTIQSVENNLSISNMGFEDFVDSVDDDGLFRGFR
jgi:uncharacterized protein DUF6924